MEEVAAAIGYAYVWLLAWGVRTMYAGWTQTSVRVPLPSFQESFDVRFDLIRHAFLKNYTSKRTLSSRLAKRFPLDAPWDIDDQFTLLPTHGHIARLSKQISEHTTVS